MCYSLICVHNSTIEDIIIFICEVLGQSYLALLKLILAAYVLFTRRDIVY